MQDSAPPPDDSRFTAYALGELEGDERASVEAALHRDPALREVVEDIRAAASRMAAALATEPVESESIAPWRATFARRPSALPGRDCAVAGETVRLNGVRPGGAPGKLIAFPALYFVVGGLAAAGFAVFALRPAPLTPVPGVRRAQPVAVLPAGAPPTVTVPLENALAPAPIGGPGLAGSPGPVAVVPTVGEPAADLPGKPDALPEREEFLGGLALMDQARPPENVTPQFKYNTPSIGSMALDAGFSMPGAGMGVRAITPPVIVPYMERGSNFPSSNPQAVPRPRNEAKFFLPGFKSPASRGEGRGPAGEKRASPLSPVRQIESFTDKPVPANPNPEAPGLAPLSSEPITPEMLESARARVWPGGGGTDLFPGPRRD